MQMPVIMWQGKFKSLTLIEVLVAVSVAILLLGVSIPLFSKNARNQNLINEAEAVAGFILGLGITHFIRSGLK